MPEGRTGAGVRLAIDVKAQVVNITTHQPQPTDEMFVDTNVLFWLVYNKATQPATGTISARFEPIGHERNYGRYLAKMLDAGAKPWRSCLSLTELAHRIERFEFEMFKRKNRGAELKEFRRDFPEERREVVSEVLAGWAQIETLTVERPLTLGEDVTQGILTGMGHCYLDAFDHIMASAFDGCGIRNVLTHDSDFGSLEGITVYTANRTLLDLAIAQNRLLMPGQAPASGPQP